MNNRSPTWARLALQAAGVYNLLWGAWVILFPMMIFDLIAADRPRYPEIWQCVGMIVGVYGIGYLIAASDPRRHWPMVLVGLLGKIFGPIGFIYALEQGVFPWQFGLNIITNDLIWWLPFLLILWDAYKHSSAAQDQIFIYESIFEVPQQTLFDFHERPDALSLLIPPWEKITVEQTEASLAVGSKVMLKNKVGPLNFSWHALHTVYDPPQLFVDIQEKGPFASWKHYHHCLAAGEKSILRDEVRYRLPLGLLGLWFGGWLVRRKLRNMFTYRHARTAEILQVQRQAC